MAKLKLRSPFTFKSENDYALKAAAVEVAYTQGLKFWTELSESILKTITSSTSRLDLTTVAGQTLAFGRCAPVASIISRISEASTNGKFIFVNEQDEEVTKVNNNLFTIVQRPNIMQTWTEFVASAVSFIKIHGQCYILPITPVGFEQTKGTAKSLYVIPNYLVTPNYTGKSYYQTELKEVIKDYTISGITQPVPADQMIVVRDNGPTVTYNDTKKMLEGMSRLYPLSDQVNNLIAIQDALYALTTKRGALGAWVNDSADLGSKLPLTQKERDEVLDDFGRYGMGKDKSPFMVLRNSLKWVQAAMGVADLKLFEGNESGIQSVAMAYNMPMYLLGLKDSTFNNLETAGKSLYTNTVIPVVDNLCSSLTGYFDLQGGVSLKAFYDHLEIFQKSKKDEADALQSMSQALDIPLKSGTITRTEFRLLWSKFMPKGYPFDPMKPEGNDYFTQPEKVQGK